MEEKKRCEWCNSSEAMIRYHDEEWGIPLHDDKKLFEFLSLESLQCGLSWELMIKKRDIFRECFAGFDYNKTASFTEQDINRILNTPGMLKSANKIKAVINNARLFIDIIEEKGSFSEYLWEYTGNTTYTYKSHEGINVARNELSDKISADLKRRGFKYIGTITVYAYLQSCGIINDHSKECFLYKHITKNYPNVFLD